MEKRIIRVGSRESALAVAQTWLVLHQIEEAHPEITFELVTMKTTGDKILDRTLDKVGGKGLFVKELDRALRAEEVDITVHSLKDVPMEVPEDLPLLAFAKRGDPRDAVVLRQGTDSLQPGMVIGCSSARRVLQLKKLYPECTVKPVRGNIITRLAKLDAGEYDALILAAAGLDRMELSNRVSRYLEPEEMIPAAGQGILVIQGRKDGDYDFLKSADDPVARASALAERAFVRELDGGCSSPVAAFSVVSGDEITLTGLYPHPETGEGLVDKITGKMEDAEILGVRLAKKMAGRAGKVWLVGAGPGDPGLFTVKGQALLEQAEVVVYDRLVGPGILARIPRTAEAIDVGKKSGNHPVPQWRINEILLEKALEGKRVVRLKGGDPFVFGRGGEELELLIENNVPFEVVPGITSAVAVPAYNGIPVTHRDCTSSFHVITGHTRKGEGPSIDFKALVSLNATLVFLMGLSALGDIAEGLMGAGMDPETPAAVLEKGTTAHQRKVVSTLNKIEADTRQAGIESPAIIVVGKVCAYSEQFAWAEKRPLGGVRVLVTRPQESALALTAKLTALGAEVTEIPSIETVAIPDNTPLQEVLSRISEFGWLTLTSPAGVRIFFEELLANGLDVRALSGIKIAAVGSATAAALRERGIRADAVPATYDGAHLGEMLAKEPGKILLIRAETASTDLPEILRQAGRDFEEVPLYRTVFGEDGVLSPEEFFTGPKDFAAFTSGSTVEGFVRRAEGMDFSKVHALCIGEQTAKKAREAGMQVLVSDAATMDSMVEKLVDYNRNSAV